MKTTPNTLLSHLDEDHLRALADAAVNRRHALRQAGRLGMRAMLASVPLAFASVARPVFGQSMPATVTEVLNFALTLEYLEAEFYRLANASGVIPGNLQAVFGKIGEHEAEHVALLQSVLGADAVTAPTFDFTAGGAFDPFNTDNPDAYGQYLALAQAFEDTGVRAYKGQAANLISDPDTLTVALQIHSVEARHASLVRRVRGRPGWLVGGDGIEGVPVTDPVYAGEDNVTQAGVDVTTLTSVGREEITEAFDEPLVMDDVLAIASLFIVA